MRTSGVILDFYDDSRGEVLREIYPSREELPETVKQAHFLSPGERQTLPDDVFALVLLNEGDTIRKYACADGGNTILSIAYFLKNGHKLPEEAQKTAAANLKIACSWYDIQPPEQLEKIALLGFVGKRVMENPLGALQTAYTAPAVAKGVSQEIKTRNDVARAAGTSVVTPHQVNEVLGRKHAEVSGTPDMPLQPSADKKAPVQKAVVKLSTIDQPSGIGHLLPGHRGETDDQGPGERSPGPDNRKGPVSLPQMHLKPHVDVTGKEAARAVIEKKASLYALGDQYPLDSYKQVEAAARYFNEWGLHFSPADRRTFCVALVKRASALDIPVSTLVRKYGAETFAPEEEIKIAFAARRSLLGNHEPSFVSVLDGIERRARERFWKEAGSVEVETWDPTVICAALEEFDKVAGLNHSYDSDVPDPYFSVYGEKEAEDSDYSWSDVNDYITAHELEAMAKTSIRPIVSAFGEDLAKEFRKDPVGVFKSLPLAQKKIVARMAAEPATSIELGT